MLQTQVNYWNYKETQRHNIATEQYYTANLGETQRHNVVSEALIKQQNDETTRHNLESERFNWGSLAETTRHNMSTEIETNRHNVAYETETNRHNVVTENETMRHNVANENETRRHNREEEGIGWYNANTQRFAAQSTAAYQQMAGRAALIQANAASANATTNRINASTNKRNADINQQNANTNFLRNEYYNSSVQSQNELNAANQELAEAKSHYIPQENARAWINTFSNTVKDVSDATKSIFEIFKKGR